MTTDVINQPRVRTKAIPETNSQATDKAIPGHARLAIWLNTLPQNALPIDTHIAKQILRLLKEEDCDSLKLARLVKHDPILCLKLFHCADNALQHREGDIQHIAHLISLIGFSKVEHVIRHSKCSSTKPYGLEELLFVSQFVAHLSNELLARKHGASNERFFLPSLFFNAPLWMTWIAAPKTAAQGQQLASREQQGYLDTCQQKLGFPLEHLLKKAHTFVHLPPITYKALHITPQQELRFWAKALKQNDVQFSQWMSSEKTARHHFNNVETGIYLLNQYVMAVYLDWNGKHIERYHSLLCRYFNKEAAELNADIIEQAMSADMPTHLKKNLAPLYRLKGLHKGTEEEKDQSEEEQQEKAIQSTLAHRRSTKSSLSSIEQWLRKIRQSDDIDNALEATLTALSQGVGVEHCIIMDVDNNTISTQAHYGFTPESPIDNFEQIKQKENNLFDQLLQKPACISIRSQDLAKAAKKIPEQFSQYCPLQPCGLLSIFQHNKPKALIYCDQDQWDQKTHHYFKAVGHSLSQTLQQMK